MNAQKTTRFFIAGTGTGAGKTTLTEALILAARESGRDAIGLKPIETGCGERDEAADALLLAKASDAPELADFSGFYRAKRPLAPLAATLEGEPPPPEIPRLIDAIARAEAGRALSFIEGAGGLLVPYSEQADLAELALALKAPLILVAADRLGTLSSTLTAIESAERRGLSPSAIVLSGAEEPDLSSRTNLDILRKRRPDLRFFAFPHERSLVRRVGRAAELLEAILKAPNARQYHI